MSSRRSTRSSSSSTCRSRRRFVSTTCRVISCGRCTRPISRARSWSGMSRTRIDCRWRAASTSTMWTFPERGPRSDAWWCSWKRNGSKTSRRGRPMLRMKNAIGSGAARFLVLVVIVVTSASSLATKARAGSDERKGTAGAMELQIPIGARGTALGGTVGSDVSGIEAMFWNPAGLANTSGTEALFTHTNYFADMKLNYVGIATKAGGLGTIGLAAKVLSIGDVIVTTEQAPDGTGEIIDPTFAVMGLSWGKAFTDRVNFGTTVNYVREAIANNTANGVGFDFGVQYDAGWKGLHFGLAVKNIGGSMTFTGPGFEELARDPNADPNAGNRTVSFSSAGFEMPTTIAVS